MPVYRSLFSGVAQIAEEVGQAGRANRELFEQLVAGEVGRVAARLGLVPAAELHEARERVDVAQGQLDLLRRDLDALRLRVAALEADDRGPAGDDEPDLPDDADLLGDETGSARP